MPTHRGRELVGGLLRRRVFNLTNHNLIELNNHVCMYNDGVAPMCKEYFMSRGLSCECASSVSIVDVASFSEEMMPFADALRGVLCGIQSMSEWMFRLTACGFLSFTYSKQSVTAKAKSVHCSDVAWSGRLSQSNWAKGERSV